MLQSSCALGGPTGLLYVKSLANPFLSIREAKRTEPEDRSMQRPVGWFVCFSLYVFGSYATGTDQVFLHVALNKHLTIFSL